MHADGNSKFSVGSRIGKEKLISMSVKLPTKLLIYEFVSIAGSNNEVSEY